MKSYKPACLLLILISFAACSYGQVWKQYADSAKIYQGQQKTDKAIEFYSKAIEILKKDSIGTITYATFCNNLANLYRGMGQYEKVEPLYLEAKAIREKVLGKYHPDYANSCNGLAMFYMEMGQYEKAELLFVEAKAIQEKALGKNHPNYAASCNGLAMLYDYMGQDKKAEPLYVEAKVIREKALGKNHPDYANSCYNLALLYMKIGQYEKAESLHVEAKAIREKILGKNHPDYANSCNDLATLYYFMGQYKKAELLFIEAKAIQEKALGKNHPDYAACCNNLAMLYVTIGQYEKAEPLYVEAKATLEKALGKNHPDYATSCYNLAGLYVTIGQYEKAEPLYLETKVIREKVLGKYHPDYANSCNGLAMFYMEMGQYEKAELLFVEAKAIQEKALGKNHPNYAASCNNLASLYMTIGHYEKAEPLYVEAKAVQEKAVGKTHLNYANSCNKLASLYMKMGHYEKAEPLYVEAKAIREKAVGKTHPHYANSCNNLATLYWLLHQPLQAEKEFEESFSANSYNLSSVFQFTNEKEKASYIKNVSGEDDDAYSFYISEKDKSEQPYSLSLFHRNLILSSSISLKKQLFATNDVVLINRYEEWITLKKQLSILYSKPIAKRKEDVITLEEKAGLLEKELAHLSSAFSKRQQQLGWKDIQSKLKANEASIEFVSFHFTDGKRQTDTVLYVALVLRKDSLLPATVVLFTEKQLQNLLSSIEYKTNKEGVQRLYTSVGAVVNNEKSKKRSIYDLVWKPLEKELHGIKTIYFAPSGLLHRIAFAALPVNEKELLSDRYKLVQLSTTASVADQQPYYVADSDKIQLYGAISYNADTTALKDVTIVYHHDVAVNRSLPDDLTRSGQWNELPGTNKEIEGIASLSSKYRTNITSHSGINATEENIKALDGNASPAVLHIATHGFFFPDPKQDNKNRKNDERDNVFKLSDDPLMRSGLLFAGANNAWQNKPVAGIDDGILTAYEVSNLYLPNTKLVVLSACETGLGDIQGNEGVYGLQRAFKMAGAQNLVMSLWKVSDLETAEFMEAFYKNMFAKQTISNAFYNAQNIMKNKYRQQPYKWAAWILVR